MLLQLQPVNALLLLFQCPPLVDTEARLGSISQRFPFNRGGGWRGLRRWWRWDIGWLRVRVDVPGRPLLEKVVSDGAGRGLLGFRKEEAHGGR
ncbi:hypothetical protein C8R47DRAFT_809894 [Mycena vitilis]|nr:hypothetical protein C8R47DRAFT_809894 [Mycena vitilis]